jgi:hypothetical protein
MGLMGTLGPMINSWACSHFLPLNGMVFLVRTTRLSSWTRHGWVEGDDAPEAKLRLTIEQSESLQRMPPPHWSVLQLTDRSSSRITASSGARGRRRRKHSRSTTQSTVRSRTDPGRVLFPGLQLPWRSTSSRAAATSPATNNRCIYRSPARQVERRRGRQRPFFTGITVQREHLPRFPRARQRRASQLSPCLWPVRRPPGVHLIRWLQCCARRRIRRQAAYLER